RNELPARFVPRRNFPDVSGFFALLIIRPASRPSSDVDRTTPNEPIPDGNNARGRCCHGYKLPSTTAYAHRGFRTFPKDGRPCLAAANGSRRSRRIPLGPLAQSARPPPKAEPAKRRQAPRQRALAKSR